MVRQQPKLEDDSAPKFLLENWPWVALILLMLLGNYSYGRAIEVLDPGKWYFALVREALEGFRIGQPAILAFMLVFLPIKLVERCIVVSGACIFFMVVMAVGISHQSRFMDRDEVWQEIGMQLGTLPLVCLGIAIPFLAMQYYMGWNVVFFDQRPTQSKGQFALIDLLVLIVMFAFSFAILNFQLPHQKLDSMMFAVFASGLSLVVLVPLTYFFMRAKYYAIWWLIGVLALVLILSLGNQAKLDWIVFKSDGVMEFAALALFTSTLVFVRLAEGRMVTGAETSQGIPSTDAGCTD